MIEAPPSSASVLLLCLSGRAGDAQQTLQDEGLWVTVFHDLRQALDRVQKERPDLLLVLLEGSRPSEWQECMRLASAAGRPMLVLTQDQSIEARLTALASGADDVLTCPYDALELVARARALLRRSVPELIVAARLRHQELELDVEGHRAHLGGRPLELTPVEFRLLQTLLEAPQRTFSRDELLTHVHTYDDDLPLDRSVDVHIRDLRQKLGDVADMPRYIATVRGVGYRLAAEPEQSRVVGSRAELNGRSAIVTGGGRGIGEAIARALAAAGAKVALVARTEAEVQAVAADVRRSGGAAEAVVADVTDPAQVRAAVERTIGRQGGLDILVCAAGMAASLPLVEMDDDLWDQLLAVNLTSAFYAARAVLPHMIERQWGRIINIASTGAKIGYAYTSGYCAAKHGLLGLTRALAVEVVSKGITVNAVCPGFAATAMTQATAQRLAQKTGRTIDEALDSLARFSPQRRLIEPREVARVVLMLAGEGAGGITGQGINVDGGAVMS